VNGYATAVVEGLAAGAIGVWLAWLFRLEQVTVKSRTHSLVLVSVLTIGSGAIWLGKRYIGPPPVDFAMMAAYLAAVLGLVLMTGLPDQAVEWLRRTLESDETGRSRMLACGGVAALLLAAMPLALGVIRSPQIGLIALVALTLRILTPIPAVVPIALGVAAALLLG
jgi:hypothetical protein